MISITKIDETDAEHGQTLQWLAIRNHAYIALFPNGTVNPRPSATQTPYLKDYRKDSVKDALRKETRDKCAYCEWKYNPGSWGDVEHILPKANDWKTRLLDYRNLTISCSVCNVNKSDYEEPGDPLISPYDTDPRDHLRADGPFLAERTRMGTVAIEILDLNREKLVAARGEAWKRCREKFARYLNESNPRIKRALLQDILDDHDVSREFALTRRSFYAKVLPGINNSLALANRAEP